MCSKNNGSEMNETESICQQQEKGTNKGLSIEKWIQKVPAWLKPVNNKLTDRLAGVRVSYVFILVFLIASAFLVWGDIFQISYRFLEKEQIRIPMFPEGRTMRVWRTCYFHGYVAAIFVMILPLIQEKSWRKWNFVGAFVMPIAALLWLLSLALVALMEMQEGMGELLGSLEALSGLVDLKAGLTLSGWLMILMSVAGPILVSFETEKLKK